MVLSNERTLYLIYIYIYIYLYVTPLAQKTNTLCLFFHFLACMYNIIMAIITILLEYNITLINP